jgi:hypothetical protein
MQYFFILSHLGCRVNTWNKVLTSNQFLISSFVYKEYNVYYNKDIKFDRKNSKRNFSRFFDILVHNWQIGFKDTLDSAKIIYLRNDTPEALQNIRDGGVIHRNCASDYLKRRKDFIYQLLKRNKNHLIIDDNFDNINKTLLLLADFVHVPPEFKLTQQHFI